jgi:D-alanyl-lipoteichoic acid acyltransferase DltB (MBOAT superfamily)
MLFNSYQFLFIFLPVALCGFFLLGRFSRPYAAAWLALASLFFYGYWSVKYVPLLLGSVLFNYLAGRYLTRHSKAAVGRGALTLAIAVNLALLGFYKYTDFFLSTVNDLAITHLPLLHIALPIGISFFTFTQIAFLVDAYRSQAREYRFAHYLVFVTYFPHLIAGPILHHAEIMPQFELAETYRSSARAFSIGLTVFAIGLAKKVLIADNLGLLATPIFDAAHAGVTIRFVAAWGAVLAYAFQLYFDFSGYSDMAIGISKLFGIDLPINFNSPYRSANIIEFWQRWHMTLSRFLRDYLYFPLGGNRRGKARRYVNLMITMLLGGLWHGANYTFLIWGGIHGAYLTINHAWRATGVRWMSGSVFGKLISGAFTFLAVTIAWVFFRSEDLKSALNMLQGMSGFHGLAVHEGSALGSLAARWFPGMLVTSEGGFQALVHVEAVTLLYSFAAAALVAWTMPNTRQIAYRIEHAFDGIGGRFFYLRAFPVYVGVLLVATLLQMQEVSPFLYFQF